MSNIELNSTEKAIMLMRVSNEVTAAVLEYAYATDEKKKAILSAISEKKKGLESKYETAIEVIDITALENFNSEEKDGNYASEGAAVGGVVGAAIGAAVGGVIGAAIGSGAGNIIGETIGFHIQK